MMTTKSHLVILSNFTQKNPPKSVESIWTVLPRSTKEGIINRKILKFNIRETASGASVAQLVEHCTGNPGA